MPKYKVSVVGPEWMVDEAGVVIGYKDRRGVEHLIPQSLPGQTAEAIGTPLDAVYRDGAGNLVAAGNIIPSVGGATSFAQLTDKATVDLTTINTPLANALAAEVTARDAKVANDLTASTTVAPSKTAVNTAIAALLSKAGGTMTGAITLAGDAANALEPVSKQQFDNAIQGFKSKGEAEYMTVAALPSCTYANGASGVGATLTATANGALSVDAQAVTAGEFVAVNNQASTFQNGLYLVTQAGSGGTPFILTRAVNMDVAAEFVGAMVFVTRGATKGGSILYSTAATSFVVGTTAFSWSQSAATLASTDALTEGSTNLYHTVARVRAVILTGIDLTTNAVVAATDSVMGAIGKLSARLEALITTVAGKVTASGGTLTNGTLAGITIAAGAEVIPPAAMGANAIDIASMDNTKTFTTAVPYTWSAAPTTAGQMWGITINVTTAGIVTLPSFISALTQGSARTTMFLPLGVWTLIFKYNGTNVVLYGEPGSVNNYAASTDPAVTDDGTKGYAAGSLWINATGHKLFFCESSATGAAVWTRAGGSGAGDMVAANNLSDVANAATARGNLGAAPIASPTFTGTVTLAADAASALQAVTLQQLQAAVLGAGKRSRVRAATTANITISTALNNADVLDGVTLATGDLVLVKNQTTTSENGVYVVGVTPARAAEYDTYNEHPGSLIAVEEGAAANDTIWFCTSNEGGTLNSTAIAFSQLTLTGSLLAASNLSDVANATTARTNLGAAALAVNQSFTKGQAVTTSALTDGATINTDASLSNKFRVTLGGNRTLANPTNMLDGQAVQFRVIQDGTGSRTLAYGNKFKWPGGTAPTLTTAAAAVDLVCCEYDSTSDTLTCNIVKDIK